MLYWHGEDDLALHSRMFVLTRVMQLRTLSGANKARCGVLDDYPFALIQAR